MLVEDVLVGFELDDLGDTNDLRRLRSEELLLDKMFLELLGEPDLSPCFVEGACDLLRLFFVVLVTFFDVKLHLIEVFVLMNRHVEITRFFDDLFLAGSVGDRHSDAFLV